MCVVLPVVDVGDYASRLTLMPARSGDQSEGNSVSTRDRHDTRCVKSNGHHRCIGVHSTVRSSEVNRHRVHDAVKNVVFRRDKRATMCTSRIVVNCLKLAYHHAHHVVRHVEYHFVHHVVFV